MWGKTWIAFTCLYKRPQSGKLSHSSRESADAAHLYLTTRGRFHETSLPAAQYLPGAPLKLAKTTHNIFDGLSQPAETSTWLAWLVPLNSANHQRLEHPHFALQSWRQVAVPTVLGTSPSHHSTSGSHCVGLIEVIKIGESENASFIFIHLHSLPLDSVELMVKLRLRFCCLMLWRSKRTEMWRINTNVVKPPWSPSFLRLKHTSKSTAQILHTNNPISWAYEHAVWGVLEVASSGSATL